MGEGKQKGEFDPSKFDISKPVGGEAESLIGATKLISIGDNETTPQKNFAKIIFKDGRLHPTTQINERDKNYLNLANRWLGTYPDFTKPEIIKKLLGFESQGQWRVFIARLNHFGLLEKEGPRANIRYKIILPE